MKKYTLILLSIFSLLSTSAFADHNIYGRADLGLAIPSGKVNSQQWFYSRSGNKSFQNAFIYSIGAGYQINSNFRTDLTYNRVDNLRYSTTTAGNRWFSQKMRLQSIMLNAYYDLPLKYSITPYLGVGLGYSEINPSNALTSNSAKMISGYFTSKKAKNLSYSLMAGASVNLNKNLSLDMGYKFQDYGKAKGLTSYQISGNGNTTSGLLKDPASFRMRMHAITAGLRLTF